MDVLDQWFPDLSEQVLGSIALDRSLTGPYCRTSSYWASILSCTLCLEVAWSSLPSRWRWFFRITQHLSRPALLWNSQMSCHRSRLYNRQDPLAQLVEVAIDLGWLVTSKSNAWRAHRFESIRYDWETRQHPRRRDCPGRPCFLLRWRSFLKTRCPSCCCPGSADLFRSLLRCVSHPN